MNLIRYNKCPRWKTKIEHFNSIELIWQCGRILDIDNTLTLEPSNSTEPIHECGRILDIDNTHYRCL